MKNLTLATKTKNPKWAVSILTAAIYLLPGINAMSQAPAPTDPYIADVTSFGATANDDTDDTQAIQTAINDVSQNHPGGTVLVPDGIYWVKAGSFSPYNSINLKNNMTFKMTSGATIKLKPNNLNSYAILYIVNSTNVNVVGGTVCGERHQHLLPSDFANSSPSLNGEWGMGIWIEGCSNIYLDGITVRECWSDGFYITGGAGRPGRNTNVTINNCVGDDIRRSSLTLENVDGMIIQNSTFKNTQGAWPKCGCDIEPYWNDQLVTNV